MLFIIIVATHAEYNYLPGDIINFVGNSILFINPPGVTVNIF